MPQGLRPFLLLDRRGFSSQHLHRFPAPQPSIIPVAGDLPLLASKGTKHVLDSYTCMQANTHTNKVNKS